MVAVLQWRTKVVCGRGRVDRCQSACPVMYKGVSFTGSLMAGEASRPNACNGTDEVLVRHSFPNVSLIPLPGCILLVT